MRFKAVLLTLSLALLLLPSGVPFVGAESARACADIPLPLRNFKVEAKWQRPTVRIGSVAKMEVSVTRTAEEDPVTEEGVPYPTGRPMDDPVEGVSVGVGLLIRDVSFAAGGTTNADGKVIVKVRIENYAKPGTGSTRVFAKKEAGPPDFPSNACRIVVYEYGVLQPGPELKVIR